MKQTANTHLNAEGTSLYGNLDACSPRQFRYFLKDIFKKVKLPRIFRVAKTFVFQFLCYSTSTTENVYHTLILCPTCVFLHVYLFSRYCHDCHERSTVKVQSYSQKNPVFSLQITLYDLHYILWKVSSYRNWSSRFFSWWPELNKNSEGGDQ